MWNYILPEIVLFKEFKTCEFAFATHILNAMVRSLLCVWVSFVMAKCMWNPAWHHTLNSNENNGASAPPHTGQILSKSEMQGSFMARFASKSCVFLKTV